MKIALDCTPAIGQRAGIGQYVYQLAHSLAGVDKENLYTMYILYSVTDFILHPGNRDAGLPSSENFKALFRYLPLPAPLLHRLRALRVGPFNDYTLGGLDADIIHCTSYCIPRLKRRTKKVLATIYDISTITHPECHTKLNIDYTGAGIRDAVNYADGIITISDYTKADIVNHLNIPEEKVYVTRLASQSVFRPEEDPALLAATRTKHSLPEKYLLFVGSLEPRKNIKTLLRAYAALPPDLTEEYRLVIAGGKGWKNTDIKTTVDELRIEDNVHFLGYLSQDELRNIYSTAALFVYPSLYEGFGIPILEAMACGTPVITSNTSSMPEVAGTAAKLVTPTDTGELSSAMESVLMSEELRADMRLRGLKRAAEFSWEKCASQTLEVYKKLL